MSTPDRIYGIWVPSKGWLKIKDDVYAETDLELLKEVCKFIGMKSSIRILDKSCHKELEVLYLQKESKKLWHSFRNYLAPRINKLHYKIKTGNSG